MHIIQFILSSLLLLSPLSMRADDGPRRIGLHSTAPLKSVGSPRIPVILVQFPDISFSVAATAPQVNDFFDLFCNGTRNGQRYGIAGSYGSVRDYFIDQSDSIFQPEFYVIGPITLDESYAYYGGNSGSTKDIGISYFYTEAIEKAMEIHPDWTDFDSDGDGTIDMIYFIYAGEGENGTDDTNTIWPKEMTASRTIGTLKFMCYACCNELYRGECDGIGVMCHELSHALGLPDFYDTGYKAYGLDYWDLMDSGCYCLSSYHPCGYSAYERDFMQWRPLVTLEAGKTQRLTLRPMSEGGVGYKIVNPENPNEYYIIENRQNTGWDTYIGRGTASSKRHGLLISHYDYLRSKWTTNSVNTDMEHQRATIIPADGKLDSYMYVNSQEQYNMWAKSANGDPFPGLQNVAHLFADHQPVYTTSGSMYQPLTGITEHEDGTITLTFCMYADVNGDGDADTQDVLQIYETMQAIETATPYMPDDVNNDHMVDTQDVLKVYEQMQSE